MITGLWAFGAAPALAQPAKPPAKAAPAKAAKAAKAPPAPKPLSEAQKKVAARKAYKDAEAKYKENDFQHALEFYKTADDLIPVPVTKYKIAVCLDKLGQVTAAAAAYQVFLDASPDPAKLGDAIADAHAQLDKLKKTPGKFLIAIAPPDAPKLAVSVDGKPPLPAAALAIETVAPPGQPPTKFFALTLPPGHHRIAISAEGYDPTATELDLPFATTKDAHVALHLTPPPPPPPPPPAAPPAPPPPPPPPPRSNVPAYVTLGLAGAGVIVGTAFGVMALKDKSTFNSTPTTDNADKTDRDALVSDMSFAVALTFGVTGAVLLLSNDTAEPAKTGINIPSKKHTIRGFVTPYAGPNGGGAVGVLNF